MTKTTSLHRERFGLSNFKDRSKFDEKFPDLSNNRPVAKPPSFSSIIISDTSAFIKKPSLNTTSLSTGTRAAYVSEIERRRHTWSGGLQPSFELNDEEEWEEEESRRSSDSGFSSGSNSSFTSDERRRNSGGSISIFSGQRRRSSTSSIQEDAIEECPSDEEEDEEQNATSIDYMKCKNCSDDKSLHQGIHLDNINYCFKCKHLYHKKTLFGMVGAFDQGRRSSWTAGERRELQFQRSSSRHSSTRGSMSGSLDLPAISEPDSDETNLTLDKDKEEQLQQRVQEEVDKLTRFRSQTLERSENISCEKNLKREFLKRLNVTSRSMDSQDTETNPFHCSTLQEFRCKGTVTIHTASIEVFHPF